MKVIRSIHLTLEQDKAAEALAAAGEFDSVSAMFRDWISAAALSGIGLKLKPFQAERSGPKRKEKGQA